MKRKEFTDRTIKAALRRQDSRCASCGTRVYKLGKEPGPHAFGEWVEAHHVRHANAGGDSSVENCVVICQSCHYSAHGGGDYRDNSEMMQGTRDDFPCYDGTKEPRCMKLAAEMDEKFGGLA
jgi:5-methylcytosine-specific restriction endonuclease McrA